MDKDLMTCGQQTYFFNYSQFRLDENEWIKQVYCMYTCFIFASASHS